MVSKEPSTQLVFRVENSVIDVLDAEAKSIGMNRTAIARKALYEYAAAKRGQKA